jgi:uncharacterized protein YbjQ (UPF0145 family)
MEIIAFFTLLATGFFIGRFAESSHLKSIRERESVYSKLPAVTIKNCLDPEKTVAGSYLVSGSVVISIDYFKRVLANLRNIFGGNVRSYETLIDRGRREAILRLKESAPTADIIMNLRIETSSIGRSANEKNSIGSIEVLAYGTAVKYKKGLIDSEL